MSPFVDRVPPPATGAEIQIVYDRVLTTIGNIKGEAGAEEFKVKCKDYGQNRCEEADFISYLETTFSREVVNLLPDIVKLLQDKEKRQRVWVCHFFIVRFNFLNTLYVIGFIPQNEIGECSARTQGPHLFILRLHTLP